jgi:flagellar basal-body rod protein FlgG
MLISALYVSNTGLQAASAFLDLVSNNVANADTTGFKTQQISFQDLIYLGLEPGASTPGVTPPGPTQLGAGVAIDATAGLFTQGPLVQSTGPLDLAITGEGFFAVTLPDGTTGYTRAGNFHFDNAGNIVSADGFRLAGGIVVPQGSTNVSVSPAGVVTATAPDGTIQQLGAITLSRFVNPSGLLRVGSTTFTASPAAGAPTTGAPGSSGLGTISQGFLEQSNVNLSNELVNLIIAQRAFSFNTQAIQVENATIQSTFDLIQ